MYAMGCSGNVPMATHIPVYAMGCSGDVSMVTHIPVYAMGCSGDVPMVEQDASALVRADPDMHLYIIRGYFTI